jgi:protein-tyrosine-phosphatase
MAEALLNRQVMDVGQSADWQIQSAGTWAEANLPVTAYSQVVMAQRGIDLSAHRSRSLTAELLREAAVILVMTRHHQEAIQVEFPEVAHKTLLISQLVGQSYDIEDPYGRPLEEYQMCADSIDQILKTGFANLRRLALTDGAKC